VPHCQALVILLGIPPLEMEERQPKVKRIGYLGDSGDHPSSSLLGCALWIRAFIIKYNLGGNRLTLFLENKTY
jgi:hypothetical protein